MQAEVLCGDCFLPVDMRQPGIRHRGFSVAHPRASDCLFRTREAMCAWHHFLRWLDGTPEQWEDEANRAYRAGRERGADDDRHTAFVLRAQLNDLEDRHAALIKRVAEGQAMMPPHSLVIVDPKKVTP